MTVVNYSDQLVLVNNPVHTVTGLRVIR